MQIKRFLVIAFLFFISCFSFSVYGQRIITGKVINMDSQLPVEGVAVTVFRGTAFAVTNERGQFQMTISEKDSLVLTHPDYKSGGLKPPDVNYFVITLEQYNYYPSYIEGEKELYRFLQTNIKYPRRAINNDIEGVLYVEVMIDSTGRVVEYNALNKLGKNCEDEILEVFSDIPGKWEQYQEPVKKRIIFPLIFQISNLKRADEFENVGLPRGKVMKVIYVTAFQTTGAFK